MKDYLAALVQRQPPTQARNIAREYLQTRILESLQRVGAMIPLAFYGGTALRLLYHIPRYSEDLDFTLERVRETYDFRGYLETIRSSLAAEGYEVRLSLNVRRVVHSAFVRFAGLPYHLDLSPHRDEALAIKIEVDTNPPEGVGLATTVIRRHVVLHLQHHDRASLLAGKLHAILQRPYAKGRDLYDLLWYLSDPGWPPPNLTLLNNALRQSGWRGATLGEGDWRAAVAERVAALPWERVLTDVQPFLEPQAVGALTKVNLLSLLSAA